MFKSELNPNHPVTQEMRENWHKIAAIIMHKMNVKHLTIDSGDVQRLSEWLDGGAICAKPKGEVLEIFLVDATEAQRLAREEGGLEI